jgi:hypothetical protein
MATTTSALELIAVEVRADLNQLTAGMGGAVRVVDQSMDQIDRSVKSTERAIVVSAGNINQAMARTGGTSRVLGQQLSQVGQQALASGNLLQALAIQLPDIALGMSAAGNSAKGFSAFLGGPWGTALVLATSIAISLSSALFDGAEASDTHGEASKSLADAIRDQTKATQGAIQTSQQAEDQNYREAQSLLSKAKAARQATIALLQAARERAIDADAQALGGRALNFGANFGAQNAARDIDRINATLAEQNKLLADQEENVRRADIPRLRRRAEEATDKATAAEGRYNRAVAEQDKLRQNGVISERQYVGEVTRLGRVRDAEVDAANKSKRATDGDAKAKREAAKAARELAAAQKELERTLDSLVGKYDPVREAANRFRDTLTDIDKLVNVGALSQGDAIGYRLKAAAEQAAAIAEAASAELKKTLGFTLGGDDDPNIKMFREWDKEREQREQASVETEQRINEERKSLQENQIRTAASLYEDLFRGGTDAVWRDFEDIGISVITRVLAQFTLSQLGSGGGFNLGSAISSAFGAVLGFPIGFAGGGSFKVNGRGGTDRNTLSLNGRPIANVSRGETVSVTGGIGPRGASRGGDTIIQVDARGAVMNDEFAAMILSQAKQYSADAGRAAYASAVRDTPAVMAKRQRYG